MDLINHVNRDAEYPLLSMDKIMVGNMKDDKNPVVNWILFNHQHGKSIAFGEETLKIPIFSLFTGEIAAVFPPAQQDGIMTCKAKNYVNITSFANEFGEKCAQDSKVDSSVSGFWKWIKEKLTPKDLFSETLKEYPELEFATEFITHSLVLTQYDHRIMMYSDKHGDTKILGAILFEKVTDVETVPTEIQKKMIIHLRLNLLNNLASSLITDNLASGGLVKA